MSFTHHTTIAKRQQLEELQAECRRLSEEIVAEESRCPHNYGDPVYDPEKNKQPTGFKLVGHGSDPESVATGWYDVTVPRWKRTCLDCGKVEYTYKQKPAVMVPDFDPPKPRNWEQWS